MRVVVSSRATVLHVAGLLWATPSFGWHLLLDYLCDVGVNSPILQQNKNYSHVRTEAQFLQYLPDLYRKTHSHIDLANFLSS
jgi:hypothetical protein